MISFNRKNQIRTGVNEISYVILYIDLTKRKLFWVEMIRIRHEWYDKWTPPHHHLSNSGLTTYLSMAYMFTKPLESLIHRLGSPKCVVARISGYPDIFDVKRNFVVTVRRTGTVLVWYKQKTRLWPVNLRSTIVTMVKGDKTLSLNLRVGIKHLSAS